MLLGEIVLVALSALRANKLRSALTMLGIIIGVASVIAVVALGTGAQRAIADKIAALGTRLLNISPTAVRAQGVAVAGGQQRLVIDDARALDERATALAGVQPEMRSNQQVVYGNKNTNCGIIGTTANYLDVRNYHIRAGRMFSDAEDIGRRRVAVMGPDVAPNMGIPNPESLVGESIRIRGVQFTVVGVLESHGTATAVTNPDDEVLIPITTARFRVTGTDRLASISALAASDEQIPDAMAEIRRVLRRQHHLRVDAPDDFQIRAQTDLLSTAEATSELMTVLLSGIAAVSLVVGGIGIMNIMLVSVTERTREIGIRKALGATRRDILLQFLLEAVTLCLVGGIIGIGFGALAALAMSETAGWAIQVSLAAVLLAFAFAALVGVVFGVWPARRAAVLDPIVALRYD